MLASMLILRSSSLCFKLYLLTDLAVSPAHHVFSLRLRWSLMFRLAGVAFQMKRFELIVGRVSPYGRANKKS